jgi:hypothetical protein
MGVSSDAHVPDTCNDAGRVRSMTVRHVPLLTGRIWMWLQDLLNTREHLLNFLNVFKVK